MTTESPSSSTPAPARGSSGPYRPAADGADTGDGRRAARGVLLGAALGVPLWAGIVLLVRRLLAG